MTQMLVSLMREYGLLCATVGSLEEARAKWAFGFGQVASQEELDRIPIAEGEPVLLVVHRSDAAEPSFHGPGEYPTNVIDPSGKYHLGSVSVLELPPDEFHFFSAIRPGMYDLTKELPSFFFGMVLVHAYALFDNYLTSLLRSVLVRRPEMLGTSKQISYGDVLECYPSMERLIDRLAEKEIRELAYKSLRDQLAVMRTRFGFRNLTKEFDDSIVEASLLRNCIVHNHGIADTRLASDCPDAYTVGSPIMADKALADRTIATCRKFSVAIDREAEQVHLTEH